ncbi:MAG TPA: glycosyltransferase 87 family protein, partial [Polyangia bacterium]|nr:glycosyltransferase 87 family protein [Polyangia bacterium]
MPAAAIAIVAGVAGWVATRSLQQDFAAYWVAGAARRAGLDPYVNHLGGASAPDLWDGVAVFAHSRFLYPPIVADLFRGFAHLPYSVAKALFTGLMVAAWVGAATATARAVGGRRARAVAFAAGALFYPLHLALERGQVEPLVLLLLAAAFAPAGRRPSGAALAAAV